MNLRDKHIDSILTTPFWPSKLKSEEHYTTTHDDNDGDPISGFLDLVIFPDGDVHFKTIHQGIGYLRFRTAIGGGKFQKIRNALLILAEAIRQEGSMEDRKEYLCREGGTQMKATKSTKKPAAKTTRKSK